MLDKNYPLPIYFQLKEFIREKIAHGEWGPGDRLPSERQLSERFDISRETSRKALNELMLEGVVRREQGRGTFVAEPKLIQRLTRLTGFTEDMQQRGMRPGARVLRLEEIQAPPTAAKTLQIKPGTSIVLLERLRIAEGVPMALETSHINFDRAQELLEEDFKDRSLYDLLTGKFGVIPTRAVQRIEAGLCNQYQQELLELEGCEPLLHTQRTCYDQHGQPIEYVEAVYRGDRYVFHVELITS
ncbi:MAG: GntR family transcriptional regulator [Chloroflexota bacterium]